MHINIIYVERIMKVRLRMSFDSKIDVNTKQDNLLNNTAKFILKWIDTDYTNHMTFLFTTPRIIIVWFDDYNTNA